MAYNVCAVNGCKREGFSGSGTTFHKLPRNKERRALWIEAMKLDSNASTRTFVCGSHFQETDYTTAAGTKLRPYIVPSILPKDLTPADPPNSSVKKCSEIELPSTSANVTCSEPIEITDLNMINPNTTQDGESPIIVCRICLAMDVKMYHFEKFNLNKLYEEITGVPFPAKTSNLLTFVCWECAARLTAAAAFKEKALLSDRLLTDLLNTGNHIKKCDIETLRNKYSILNSSSITKINDKQREKNNESEKIEIEILMDKNLENDLKSNDTVEKNTVNGFKEIVELVDRPIKSEIIDEMYMGGHHFNNPMIEGYFTDELFRNETPMTHNMKKDTNKTFEIPILNYTDNVVNFREQPIPRKNVRQTKALNKTLMDRPPRSKSMNKRIDEKTRHQIIQFKLAGMPIKQMSRHLNVSRKTICLWWQRWTEEHHLNTYMRGGRKRSTTAEEDKKLIEKVKSLKSVHTPSLAQEFGISTRTARLRLKEAGFMVKQRKAVDLPMRSGGRHKVDENTKRQIITMKQNGVCVTDIANQLQVTRTSVYFWWRRWCEKRNPDSKKIAEPDMNLLEHSYEETPQTPTIMASQKTVWQKLPDGDQN